MILFFDTETTGLWNKSLPVGHVDQPRMTQFASSLVFPDTRKEANGFNMHVQCDVPIPPESTAVHGVDDARAERLGVQLAPLLDTFCDMVCQADLIVAHNIEFDVKIVNNAARLLSGDPDLDVFAGKTLFCTMKAAVPVCKFPSKWGRGWGWPKLELAIPHLFGRPPTDAHQAIGDVLDCKDLYFHLQDLVQAA